MEHRRVRAVAAVFCSLLLSTLSVHAQGTRQQVNVETLYPRQAGRGQTTVINIALPRGGIVESAEISPADGVTVSGIKGNGGQTEQAIGWWEVTLDVAKDAPPGNRSLVLVLKAGRTVPVTIAIPTHVPAISDLHVAAPPSNQRSINLQLAAVDPAGDLGETPYIWFTADCGGEPIVGTIRGKASARDVRVSIPDLRVAGGSQGTPKNKCDLAVRLTDAAGVESNTLKTTVELKN